MQKVNPPFKLCKGVRAVNFVTTTIGRMPCFVLRAIWFGAVAFGGVDQRITPSAMLVHSSPPKSAWPGVSIMLILASSHKMMCIWLMVMPRSFLRSLLSITRSSTAWLSRKVPDWRRMESISVVLPWSTCAMMAMFVNFVQSRLPVFCRLRAAYLPVKRQKSQKKRFKR